MPSAEHDIVVEMFVHSPELTLRLLELVAGTRAPPGAAVRTVSADLSSPDRNAYGDVAVVVDHSPGNPMYGVSVEVQLGVDRTRELVWPVYLVVLRRRLKRDTDLLVFCPDELVGRYRRPIRWGTFGRHGVEPIVVGYSDIPPITDPDAARELPELAVLSAAAHAADRVRGRAVLAALRPALDELPPDIGARYLNYVRIRNVSNEGSLTEEVLDMGFVYGRPLHEFDEYPELVKAYKRLGRKRGYREGREQGLEQGREQGLEQGREQGLEQGREQALAHGIVTVLESRGVALDDGARERIEQCHEHAELERWLERAATVRTVEHLFEPSSAWSSAMAEHADHAGADTPSRP